MLAFNSTSHLRVLAELLENLTSDGLPESKRREMTPELLTVIVVLSLFTLFGSVGNGLVLFVFTRVRDKTTAHLFILAMAVIDLFTSTVIIPFTIVMECLNYEVHYDFVCKAYQFLITSKVPLSFLIMVAIAFDRYFCICHPLKRVFTPRRTLIIIATLALLACILGLLTAMAYSVYQSIPQAEFTPEEKAAIRSNNLTALALALTLNQQGQDVTWRRALGESPISSTYVKVNVLRRIISMLTSSNTSEDYNQLLLEHTLNYSDNTRVVYYTGLCDLTDLHISFQFTTNYQKVYAALFLVCLVIVGVLYALIYRFISSRRSRKLRQKLALCAHVNGDPAGEGTRLTLLNGHDGGEEERAHHGNHAHERKPDSASGEANHSNTRMRAFDAERLREENRITNIRTAAMLFTVTAVFTAAFLPAWLMAHHIIPSNLIIFYLYFSYNIVNPVIYAFMNKIFKDNVKRMLQCR